MSQPDDAVPLLVSRTAHGHLSTGQCFALVWGVASFATMLWGAVQLLRGVLDDGIGLTVGGGVFAVASAVLFWRLRRASRQELEVRYDGIVLVRAGVRQGWRWTELHDVYVVGGIDRLLTLEGDAALAARARAPRSARFLDVVGVPAGQAVAIPLRGMAPDESRVLDAIRTATAGRYPTPERGPRLPGR
jgi:hypothetical protein